MRVDIYSFVDFFFFNDTATTEIYLYGHILSLHAALPICQPEVIGAAIDAARDTFERLGVKIHIGAYANAFPPQPKEATANDGLDPLREDLDPPRSEEHTSELQSLMRISYAVFCLKKKTQQKEHYTE